MSDGRRIPLWLLAAAAVAAIAVLIVAVVGRDDGPTLQAIPVTGSMSDDQAREVAEKTVLVWMRERNAGHLKNMQELTCPNAPPSWVSEQVDHAEAGESFKPFTIVALTGFIRSGNDWTINVTGADKGGMFTLSADGGRLRVCSKMPVPVPTE